MLIPILSLALAAPAPEPPAEAPKGPAPRIMVLNADKDGRAYLETSVMVTKFVPEVRTVTRVVGGQQVVQQVQVQVPVTTMEQKRLFLDEEGVIVYDADGKKIDAKNLPKQSGPAPALVSADGKEVDPFYLPLARKGTLIIVAPALAGGQAGGPSSPVGSTTAPPLPPKP
jgi:hypothetical protein